MSLDILFGYANHRDFYGPLECILEYIDIFEITKSSFLVCQDFYYASQESFLNRFVKPDQVDFIHSHRPSRSLYQKLVDKESFNLKNDLNRHKIIRFCCIMRYYGIAKQVLSTNNSVTRDIVQRIINMGYKEETFDILVANGHDSVIKSFLENCNRDKQIQTYKDDNAALKLAVRRGNCELIRVLMESDYRVKPAVANNVCIREACKCGHVDVVKLLLNLDQLYLVNPTVENNYCLRVACEKGYKDIVIMLLNDYRVNPAIEAKYCIEVVFKNKHKDIIDLLLNDNRIYNSVEMYFLFKCCVESGNEAIVKKKLNDKMVNPAAEYNYCLKVASQSGNERIVKLLLKDTRVNPSVDDNYCLRVSCGLGYYKIVKILLADKRVVVSENLKLLTLEMVCQNNYREIFMLFFDYFGTGLNNESKLIIDWAVTNRHYDILELFLKQLPFIYINFDEEMMIALRNNDNKLMEVLLADIRIVPYKPQNILKWAIELGYVKIAENLIKNNRVDLSVCGEFFIETATLTACKDRRCYGIIEPFLKNNKFIINPTLVCVKIACEYDSRRILKLLLSSKYIMDRCNFNDHFLIRYVCQKGYDEIVKILLDDRKKLADPSFDNNKCLLTASTLGYSKIVNLLLGDARINPSAQLVRNIFNNLLVSKYDHICVSEEHELILKMLLNDRRNVFLRIYSREYPEFSRGSVILLDDLIQDDNVDQPIPEYTCNLKIASQKGYYKLVRLLLNNCSAFIRSDDLSWCLDSAVSNKHYDVVTVLLKCTDVNPFVLRNSAIKWGLSDENVDIIELLLKDNRSGIIGEDIFQSIKYSVDNGHHKMVKMLLKFDHIDPSANDNYSIKIASQKGYNRIVELLLHNSCVDPSADNNYAVQVACQNGHVNIVNLLLSDERVDPSSNYNYCLRYASKNDHLEVVKLLLKRKRVDPSADNNWVIRWLSKYGYANNCFKVLLADKRINPSDVDFYAIISAIQNGHRNVVDYLIKDDRIRPFVERNDAIKVAVEYGKNEIVKLLLFDKKVDPTVDNHFILKSASEHGYADVVETLIVDNRCDPSAGNNYAVKVASSNGFEDCVRILLNDFRVNPSDTLSCAVANGYENVARVL